MSEIIYESGVVPFLIQNGVKKIVFITPKKSDDMWILPKGHIEPNMSKQQSAAKEALEEAGLIGNVTQKAIGNIRFKKNNKTFSVEFYPFEVTEILNDWDEKIYRKRIIVDKDYAKKIIRDKQMLKIIEKI